MEAHPPVATPPAVTVVMPVLNEERHVEDAIRNVLNQRYDGEIELVVALGPSTDASDAIVQRVAASDPRVRWIRNPSPSGSTPAALNAAISASRHDIVVRVDGHAILPDDYIAVAVDTLARTGADNVGGIMAAEGVTAFEQAVARAMTTRLGVGNARFHTGGDAGPADTVYLGVFRRQAVQRVGGFDESFLRAQDWEMNHRIRETGGLVWFEPRMRVTYRPRGSMAALARQYFNYGRWRRVVMRHHPGTTTLRYLAPPAATVSVLAGLLVGTIGYRPALVIPAAYLGLIFVGAGFNGRGLSLSARLALPVVYLTMHFAWGWGFLTSPRWLARTDPPARRTPIKG